MKSKRIAFAVVLALVLGGVFLYFKGKRFEVMIGQGQIDQVLVSCFPETKQYLQIFSITYSNPEVTLLGEADRVQVGMDVTLNIQANTEPQQISGGATISSGIRYEPES